MFPKNTSHLVQGTQLPILVSTTDQRQVVCRQLRLPALRPYLEQTGRQLQRLRTAVDPRIIETWKLQSREGRGIPKFTAWP